MSQDTKRSYYDFDADRIAEIQQAKNNEIILVSGELKRDSQDTVRKLLVEKDILVKEMEPDKTPQYIVDESIEWVGPTILFTASLVTQNPHLVAITIGIISNYLTDLFHGTSSKKARLSIMGETKNGRFRKLDFEGPPDKLNELPDIIRSIYDED